MERKSKYCREERRVTDEYVKNIVRPQLNDRHIEIIRFLFCNRLATSEQVGKFFWKASSNQKKLANRALRKLYDLQCIDRYFPPVKSGSSLQHVVLDSSGAKILDTYSSWNKIRELPLSYRHQVLITEFRLMMKLKGFDWGLRETKIDNVIPDVYYKDYNLAVEIDTGTESLSILREKGSKYNYSGVRSVIFVTEGSEKRFKAFASNVHIRKAGSTFKGLGSLVDRLVEWVK